MNTKELIAKVKVAVKEQNKPKIKTIVMDIATEIMLDEKIEMNKKPKVFGSIIMEISQELDSEDDENFFLLEAIGVSKSGIIEQGKQMLTMDLIKKGAKIGEDISFTEKNILLSPKAHQLLLDSVAEEDHDELNKFIRNLDTEEPEILLEKQLNVPFFSNLLKQISLRQKEMNIDAFAYYVTALVTGFSLKHPEIKLMEKILDFLYHEDFITFQELLSIIQDEPRIESAWTIYGDHKYDYFTYPLEDLVTAAGGNVKEVFNPKDNKTIKTWGLEEIEIISKLWGTGKDACNLQTLKNRIISLST